LLRNNRHNIIRKIIADQFRKKNLYEVYEEVTAVEDKDRQEEVI